AGDAGRVVPGSEEIEHRSSRRLAHDRLEHSFALLLRERGEAIRDAQPGSGILARLAEPESGLRDAEPLARLLDEPVAFQVKGTGPRFRPCAPLAEEVPQPFQDLGTGAQRAARRLLTCPRLGP